jgi:hypothetical protein
LQLGVSGRGPRGSSEAAHSLKITKNGAITATGGILAQSCIKKLITILDADHGFKGVSMSDLRKLNETPIEGSVKAALWAARKGGIA